MNPSVSFLMLPLVIDTRSSRTTDRAAPAAKQQQIDHDGKRCHAAAAGILKITEKFPELSKRLADLEKRRAVADGIEEKVDTITEPFSE